MATHSSILAGESHGQSSLVVHEVTKSRTRLSAHIHTHTHTHTSKSYFEDSEVSLV